MKNNRGFIAISLIYSFFLMFLLTLLAIVANYAHNRILLNSAKTVIKEKLNGLSEFNPILLENKTYNVGETVYYADENWIVLLNSASDVRLILARGLNKDELTNNLSGEFSASQLNQIISNNTITMCTNWYTPIFCSYANANVGFYNEYSWSISVVKKVLDNWFNENALLQKALARDSLNKMSFSDSKSSYEEYIRIATVNEYRDLNTKAWNLTYSRLNAGKSMLNVNGTELSASDSKLEVRPVIQVKKAI